MSVKDFMKGFIGSIFNHAIVDTVKEGFKETFDEVEKRATHIVHNIIKATILMMLMIVGSIFILVGLAKYMTETMPSMNHGLGFVVVGGVVILLVIFAKFMQKE